MKILDRQAFFRRDGSSRLLDFPRSDPLRQRFLHGIKIIQYAVRVRDIVDLFMCADETQGTMPKFEEENILETKLDVWLNDVR